MSAKNLFKSALALAEAKAYMECRLIAMLLGVTPLLEYVRDHNPSKDLPYHSNTHQYLVAVTAYRLYCCREIDVDTGELADLFVAALFHDFDHTGGKEDDSTNVTRAIHAYWKYVENNTPGVFVSNEDVVALIASTQWPWQVEYHHHNKNILRDADILASAEGLGFIYPIMGLPEELQHKLGRVLTPTEMAAGQKDFLSNVQLNTSQGRESWKTLWPLICESQEALAIYLEQDGEHHG